MVSFKHKGDFSKTDKYLLTLKNSTKTVDLDAYGRAGVEALASATPFDTGLTASSWYYEITRTNSTTKLEFRNSNIQNGVPIAIVLQYGHATNNGGWVEGRDYINPAIQPIFDEITNNLWREVTKS